MRAAEDRERWREPVNRLSVEHQRPFVLMGKEGKGNIQRGEWHSCVVIFYTVYVLKLHTKHGQPHTWVVLYIALKTGRASYCHTHHLISASHGDESSRIFNLKLLQQLIETWIHHVFSCSLPVNCVGLLMCWAGLPHSIWSELVQLYDYQTYQPLCALRVHCRMLWETKTNTRVLYLILLKTTRMSLSL